MFLMIPVAITWSSRVPMGKSRDVPLAVCHSRPIVFEFPRQEAQFSSSRLPFREFYQVLGLRSGWCLFWNLPPRTTQRLRTQGHAGSGKLRRACGNGDTTPQSAIMVPVISSFSRKMKPRLDWRVLALYTSYAKSFGGFLVTGRQQTRKHRN